MSDQTLFQKIMEGKIPGDFVHQDDQCIVLRDIDPQAPVHLLVIPRDPVPRLAEAEDEHESLLGHLLLVAAEMARKLDLEDGFRVVINNGRDGGESVPHLHVHVLGGRSLDWTPG